MAALEMERFGHFGEQGEKGLGYVGCSAFGEGNSGMGSTWTEEENAVGREESEHAGQWVVVQHYVGCASMPVLLSGVEDLDPFPCDSSLGDGSTRLSTAEFAAGAPPSLMFAEL